MTIRELLPNWPHLNNLEISGLSLNSRTVQVGNLFIALAGAKEHGLNHVDEVIRRGANAIVFDPAGNGQDLAGKITAIPTFAMPNLGWHLGNLAAKFYELPSTRLNIIGITGTNGKTSCSQFLAQVLDDCGIIGTLGWGHYGNLHPTVNTTPDALALQQILAEFVKQRKQTVAMEVSSHGLAQGRTNGIHFKGAVFTNITRDHLDYHGSMSEYVKAKLALLQAPNLQFAVLNLDDSYSQQIIDAAPRDLKLWGITLQGRTIADIETVYAENISYNFQGIYFEIVWCNQRQSIQTCLYGDFNVENLLCVIAVLLAMHYSLPHIADKIAQIQPVPGRMEPCIVRDSQINVMIDYAHTPDAVEKALRSMRNHCHKQLWIIFGCGGNRDAGKRPLMAQAAERWADRIIVTDDNPRFENHVAIADEIQTGFSSLDRVQRILDRKTAIQYAINEAKEGDCIVVAGKGHEDYQEIAGLRQPFSDQVVAQAALNARFNSL